LIADIVSEKLWDTDLSLRDIAEGKWISHQTVWKILNEEWVELLTTSAKARELFDINLDIINIWALKVAKAIESMNPAKISEAKEMQAIVEVAFKQNQIIKFLPTDILKHTGDLSIMSTKQLEEQRKGYME